MRGINKVTVGGYLGQNPTINGKETMASFSIATSTSWKDKDTGELKSQTEWHKVVVFGKLIEIVDKYLRKGSAVIVDGTLRTTKYHGKDNIERSSTQIIAKEINLLDSKNKEEKTETAAQPKTAENMADDELSDELPF